MRPSVAAGVAVTGTVVALATVWVVGVRSASVAAWSPPVALVSGAQYTFGPQLAVSETGEAIVGWYGGPPPKVFMGSTLASNGKAPNWTGSKVMVDVGTVAGGFRSPLLLSRHGTDGGGQLQVAVSGSGIAYAAWAELPGYRWMIAAISRGHPPVTRTLLPSGAQLLAFTAAPGGPVVVVWDATSHGHMAMQYGLLGANGRLGRVETVTPVQSNDTYADVAVNDHGQLAAVWVQGDQGPGGTPQVMVVVCRSVGSCDQPKALALGHSHPEWESVAVAISNGGTVAVVAAGHSFTTTGSEVPLGLWGAVGGLGGEFGSSSLVASTGDLPVVTADGPAGAFTVFNVGSPPVRTLAWSMIAGGGSSFTHSTLIPDPNTLYPAVLAANLRGQVVVAWTDSNNASQLSVRAVIGSRSRIGRPHLVVPVQDQVEAQSFAVGIAGNGDALLVWNENRGPDRHGLFVSTYQAR